MKKFMSIVSLTLALAVTAITTALPCFAAERGNTTIAVGTTLSNVAVAGDIDINTVSFGANGNVTNAVQNTLANVAAGGNISLDNISVLAGGSVTDVTTNTLAGVVSGGSLSINNYSDIVGRDVTAAIGNTVYNYAGNGDASINSIINSNGVATNLNEVIQNTIANSMFIGNLEVNSIGQ